MDNCEKPKAKEYIVYSSILFAIFSALYLLGCAIQSLIKYGRLGHFYIFGKRSSTIDITDRPLLIIGYFGVLLLISIIPSVLMYVKDLKNNKKNKEKNKDKSKEQK